jgi:hypothetical protein
MRFLQIFNPFHAVSRKKEQYTSLRPDMILATLRRLESRVEERFPKAGLLKVCKEFHQLAVESEQLAKQLAEPIWPVRVVTWMAAISLLGLTGWALFQTAQRFSFDAKSVHEILQATESAINELIFLCVALFFLIGLETRLKRKSALQALHRLRSIAHVIDMHQLTKDPAHILGRMQETESSPERVLDRFELNRYLDYCSELLSLIAKVSALFAQNMEDPVIVSGVHDLELLVQGMSAKIWQKIMILDLAGKDQ